MPAPTTVRCRLYLITPPGPRSGGLRRPSRRRSTAATSPACSFASRTSPTTTIRARRRRPDAARQARDVAFIDQRPARPRRRTAAADGVHVGQEDATYDEARRLVGPTPSSA